MCSPGRATPAPQRGRDRVHLLGFRGDHAGSPGATFQHLCLSYERDMSLWRWLSWPGPCGATYTAHVLCHTQGLWPRAAGLVALSGKTMTPGAPASQAGRWQEDGRGSVVRHPWVQCPGPKKENEGPSVSLVARARGMSSPEQSSGWRARPVGRSHAARWQSRPCPGKAQAPAVPRGRGVQAAGHARRHMQCLAVHPKCVLGQCPARPGHPDGQTARRVSAGRKQQGCGSQRVPGGWSGQGAGV